MDLPSNEIVDEGLADLMTELSRQFPGATGTDLTRQLAARALAFAGVEPNRGGNRQRRKHWRAALHLARAS